MEERMEQAESPRPILVGYARYFGVEITPEDESVERVIGEINGFLADIDTLDLEGAAPAATYDPAWPRINETTS